MKVVVSRNLFIVLILDIVLISGSFYLAHVIRYDFNTPRVWLQGSFLRLLPYALLIKLFFFYVFDLYKGMWRYTSLNDLMDIVKASMVGTLVLISVVLYRTRFESISRSVFVIDWCLTLLSIASLRVFVRICFEEFTQQITLSDLRYAVLRFFYKGRRKGRGVLIVGAGDCGQKICREFIENPAVQSHVVGFLDDDLNKVGRKIHGVPVLNVIDALEPTVTKTGADDVIIAISTLGSDRVRQIINLCKRVDVTFKMVPNMGEIIDGKLDIRAIRNVEYRDLLGRKPVKLDKQEIKKYIGGKCILVTGAAGSIGTGLCQQIGRFSPNKIILFERAESPLYEIDIELKKLFKDIEIIPVLGDIQNKKEVETVFGTYKPDTVFHAAAYKHVPMLEVFPWKAIENNIIGTENLVEAADHFGCSKFIFISTDKAVNPTNVMGTTKRIAEMIVQNRNTLDGSRTNYVTVRFGNVIGSAGSVVPLFKRQIEEGGPVTVTHPEVVRYFMLIPEACQLILQAATMGRGGEIFVLEMGNPVKIDNMARDLIRFSGFEPDVDIQIKYTGLRAGEKLYEELMTEDEAVVPTGHKSIHVFGCCKIDMHELDEQLQQLKQSACQRDAVQIVSQLKKIVPEYSPQRTPLLNN